MRHSVAVLFELAYSRGRPFYIVQPEKGWLPPAFWDQVFQVFEALTICSDVLLRDIDTGLAKLFRVLMRRPPYFYFLVLFIIMLLPSRIGEFGKKAFKVEVVREN